MSSILGHSHPAIVEVVKDSVSNLDHLLTSFISEPVADLANNLCALLPDPLDKTFFLNTGSEVNEAAIKIAKCSTGKFEIIAFSSSYREARVCLNDSPPIDVLEQLLTFFDTFSVRWMLRRLDWTRRRRHFHLRSLGHWTYHAW